MYEIYERILKERGLKNADVSRGTGITPSTLSDWKNGRIKELKADKLALIADFLGVSVDYLMTGNEPKTLIYESVFDQATKERLNFYYEALSKYVRLQDKDRQIVDDMIERLTDGESED